MNNFQRDGSISNAHVGREFEELAKQYFLKEHGIQLIHNFKLEIGLGNNKKSHSFDLGCEKKKILVECKSHRWTSGDNVPSAKMTVWNEAMYFFYLAPENYKKIFFILRDFSIKRNETLAQYYIRTYIHLIPNSTEIWEYDENEEKVKVYN